MLFLLDLDLDLQIFFYYDYFHFIYNLQLDLDLLLFLLFSVLFVYPNRLVVKVSPLFMKVVLMVTFDDIDDINILGVGWACVCEWVSGSYVNPPPISLLFLYCFRSRSRFIFMISRS